MDLTMVVEVNNQINLFEIIEVKLREREMGSC
jgi:hypothetical protein